MRSAAFLNSAIAAFALAAGAGGVLAGQVVINGGFESGSFSGWTTTGNLGSSAVTATADYVHSGVFGASLSSSNSPGYLSQVLACNAGDVVNISFWLRNFGDAPNLFRAEFDGVSLTTLFGVAPFGYTQYTFSNVTVLHNNPQLVFTFRHDSASFALDDVSVDRLQVAPLPTGAALGLAGLLGLAAFRRRI